MSETGNESSAAISRDPLQLRYHPVFGELMEQTMRMIALLVLGAFVATASADDAVLTYDRVSLSVEAEAQVANDTVFAELFSELEGERASEVASEVNQAITWALAEAEKVEQVSAQTTGYYSHPVHRNQTVIGWRVRQSLRLESRDTARLSQLVGILQQRLAIASVTYAISPGLRAETEDKLIARALASFQNRARLITRELGRSDFRIVQLDVATSGSPVRPLPVQRMALSMEAAESASPPSLESGVQRVSVQASGVIELKLN